MLLGILIETTGVIAPVKVPTLDKHWAISVALCGLCLGGTFIHKETSVFKYIGVQGKSKQRKNMEWKASESAHYPDQYLLLFHNSFAFLHIYFFLSHVSKIFDVGFLKNFLLWKPILLSMESHSFNSSPVCSEIVSFIFGIRRKTTLKPKFTPIKLNLIEKRQRHSLTS